MLTRSVVTMGAVVALSALALGTGPASASAVHRTLAGSPPGVSHAGLDAVTGVPHSSDVWAIGYSGEGTDNDTYFVLRRHDGKWKRLAAPKLNGRYGVLGAADAASPSVVWLGGSRQVAGGISELPTVWSLSGSKWVVAKWPALEVGLAAVSQIASSSPTNAWAVGGLWLKNATSTQVAMHWDGKKWTAVPYPVSDNSTLLSVSTSAPNNAWAVLSDGTLIQWNGKAWISKGTAPAGVQLNAVTTSSPTNAYAVGSNTTTDRPVVLHYNGHTWSAAKLVKVPLARLSYAAQAGNSVWAMGENLNSTSIVMLHSTGGAFTTQKVVGGPYYHMSSLSVESPSVAYAGGDYIDLTNDISYTYLEAYNGHSWRGISSDP
jgi:hypothetical protein